jgi:hypothetical protein
MAGVRIFFRKKRGARHLTEKRPVVWHMGSDARQNQGWWWACAGSAVVLLACSERDPACHGARCEELEVHVLTWWPGTPNGPAAPLVAEAERQPDVRKVVLRQHESKDAMMAEVEALLSSSGTEPVDTFLANAGRDVLRWTPCGGDGSSQRLLQLDTADAYPDLRSMFDPALLSGLTCCPQGEASCSQPGIYALPLGLHRINHIFFNVERFAPCADREVVDLSSFVALLSCLGEGGKRVISVPASNCEAACDGDDASCLSQCPSIAGESLSYLLESLALLPGVALEPGQDSAAPLEAAQAVVQRELLGFLNNSCFDGSCDPPRDVTQALMEVKRGDAAFLVMPDWYTSDALRPTHGLVQPAPFPGTGKTFLFMTDVFAVPLAGTPGASVEAGFRWLDTLLNEGVQQQFATEKTALPALADHSQLQLVPSLEARLPVEVDPAALRAGLDQWLWALNPKPAPMTEPTAPQPSEGQPGVPVVPCAGSPCGEP